MINRSAIITITILIACLAIAVYFVFFVSRDDGWVGETPRNEAARTLTTPDDGTAFTDLSGNPVQLDQYSQTIRVVSSWASWCPLCAADLSALDQLAKANAGNGVIVIAINRKESKEQAERYLKTLPPLTEVLVLLDPDDAFYELIDGYAMPEVVIYDRGGNDVYRHRGQLDVEAVQRQVTNLLENQ